MNSVKRITPKQEVQSSDRLIIFAFFLAGSVISYFGTVPFPSVLSPRMLLCGILVVVILSASSMFGVQLLPICSMISGFFAEKIAMDWVRAWFDGARSARIPLGSAVLIPVFFLCAVHGMAASGAIQSALSRGSPSARLLQQHEISSVAFFAVIGFAAIFYFT